MYIYRAINEFDEKIDPTKNGLIAKSIINEKLDWQFKILKYAIYDQKNLYRDMKQSEEKEIYYEVRKDLEIVPLIQELNRKADIIQKGIDEIITNLINNPNRYYLNKLLDILSTKNGHITKGSSIDYPWISFSTSLEKVKPYYENQEKNKVVVVDSNIDTFCDKAENAYLIALDLSSNKKIEDNAFIINANKTGTRLNYRGLNYSKSSNEVIYYNRVPKDKIVAVLNSLQYELLLNGLLDEGYYKLYGKHHWEKFVLSSIREILKDDGDIVKYLFEEYYVKNCSLKSLSEKEKYNLNEVNQFILNKIKQSDEVKRYIRFR